MQIMLLFCFLLSSYEWRVEKWGFQIQVVLGRQGGAAGVVFLPKHKLGDTPFPSASPRPPAPGCRLTAPITELQNATSTAVPAVVR